MQYQDHGKAQCELNMLRFVTAGVHAEPTAQTAAYECYAHQRLFRDAPLLLDGFFLVCKHKCEPKGIDYTKIKDKVFHV